MNGKTLFINLRADFCAATAGEESPCPKICYLHGIILVLLFL